MRGWIGLTNVIIKLNFYAIKFICVFEKNYDCRTFFVKLFSNMEKWSSQIWLWAQIFFANLRKAQGKSCRCSWEEIIVQGEL